jgi:hypothetical protein
MGDVMGSDPAVENHARQVIWDFLLQRRSGESRKRYYLVSYPRSGNTLVRSYFAILQGRAQLSVYAGDVVPPQGSGLAPCLDEIDIIKSHELPANSDPVIYIVRDGRNATLSFLQMSLLFGGHDFQQLDQVCEAIRWLDRQAGSWSEHVAAAMRASKTRPMLFVRYEDLVAAPENALDSMIRFAGENVATEVLADGVSRHRRSDRYAENPYNGFGFKPPAGSIFDLLQRHRRGAYWQHIFDERSRRYFHESGATSLLMNFGYEESEEWWTKAVRTG